MESKIRNPNAVWGIARGRSASGLHRKPTTRLEGSTWEDVP